VLFKKNADYSYSKNNISEDTGWKVWYDWDVVKKHTKTINIILTVILVICSFTLRKFLISNGILNLILSLILALLVWLFIVIPVHEILHLVPYVGLKLNDKCVVTISKGAVSALYDGKTKRKTFLISLILPVLILSLVITPFLFFLSSLFRIFFFFLMILNVFGSYTDVYMVFYSIFNINKTDIMFGRYIYSS
jgi:hypothetical protein